MREKEGGGVGAPHWQSCTAGAHWPLWRSHLLVLTGGGAAAPNEPVCDWRHRTADKRRGHPAYAP